MRCRKRHAAKILIKTRGQAVAYPACGALHAVARRARRAATSRAMEPQRHNERACRGAVGVQPAVGFRLGGQGGDE